MSQINPNEIIKRNILTPCEFTQIQQVGIDLTLKDRVVLPHGKSFNVLLNEVVELPNYVFSTFTHRSSYNRKGVLITGSIYDPGYKGVIGCTIYNMSGDLLIIEPNERIGQMVFFQADPSSTYEGQYQGEHLEERKINSQREAEVLERREHKNWGDNY